MVQAELGRGSYGLVLRVRGGDGADRALKLISTQGAAERTRREVELATRVRHPHLLHALESGVEGDVAYLVMELAEESLRDVLATPGRRAEAFELLRQASRGVAALHRAGAIHRDLKPENILVVQGLARVADLGLARAEDQATLTRSGTIMGSPGYMAPEQARGERAGPAADLFALGVMAYEVLEGALPYPAGLPLGELLARIASGSLDPLQRSLGRQPEPLLEAVRAALAPDPGDRPLPVERWAEGLGPLGPEVPGVAAVTLATEPALTLVRGPVSEVALDLGGDGSSRRSTWIAAGVGLAALFAWWQLPPPPPGAPRVPVAPSATPQASEGAAARELLELERRLEASGVELGRLFRSPDFPLLSRPHQPRPLRGVPQGDAFDPAFIRQLMDESYRQRWLDHLGDLRTWLARFLELRGAAAFVDPDVGPRVHEWMIRLPQVTMWTLRSRVGDMLHNPDGNSAAQGLEVHRQIEADLASLAEAWPGLFGEGDPPLLARELQVALQLLLRRSPAPGDLEAVRTGILAAPTAPGTARRVGLLTEAAWAALATAGPEDCATLRASTQVAARVLPGAPGQVLAWSYATSWLKILPRVLDLCPQAGAPDGALLPMGARLLEYVERGLGDYEGAEPADPATTTWLAASLEEIRDAWNRGEGRDDPRRVSLGCGLVAMDEAFAARHLAAWLAQRQVASPAAARTGLPEAWRRACPGP